MDSINVHHIVSIEEIRMELNHTHCITFECTDVDGHKTEFTVYAKKGRSIMRSTKDCPVCLGFGEVPDTEESP